MSGIRNMVWNSRRSFGLQLDDGQEIRGTWKGDAADLGRLLTRRVLVIGHAVYRASGRLLRIDADDLLPGDAESKFWSTVPPPMSVPIEARSLRRPVVASEGVRAFFGRWPGKETEEELVAALKELD